jgi:hypothetical protein
VIFKNIDLNTLSTNKESCLTRIFIVLEIIANYSLQRNLLYLLTLILFYGGKENISIERKVTLDEINILVKHENNSRVLKRLYFFKFRLLGDLFKTIYS